MNQSIKSFLKPPYYVLEDDKQLKLSIQMISERKQKGGLNGHALAIAQAVHSISLSFFINIPYYLVLGNKNLFLNCIHLHLEHMVLEHYKSAMYNLIYSVIATVYVAMGIFIPPVLDGFKTEKSQPDDPNTSSDFSLSTIIEDQRESDTSNGHESIRSPDRSNIHTPSSGMPSIESQITRSLMPPPYEELSNSTTDLPYSIGANCNESLDSSWEVVPKDIPSFEVSGIHLENQAHRVALNEYNRILSDRFKIELDKVLIQIESWFKSPIYKDNPMMKALYCTLCYLTAKPIAYGYKSLSYNNAKEQYIAYVSSLWGMLATKEYQEIRKGSNIKEFKDCLYLIRGLCEARFLSENHGFLRSLLQLHEYEYDRLDPEVEKTPTITRENFAQVVIAKNKKVEEAPSSMKVPLIQKNTRKILGAIGYEDFLMTDIPFLRGKQVFKNDKGEERSFYYMRHPTPHIAGSPIRIALGTISRFLGLGHIESGEAIAPEFEVMLEAIAERKEAYLIQSHQRLNDSGVIENEDSRSQTLYRLQESHKNFHVIFQAVEGDLFDRKGIYAEIKTFTDLKEAIKQSFYIEKSPNRLPKYLEQDQEYRDVVIDQLLNYVHQSLFEERFHISFNEQNEWQAFILAFYILQGDDFKFRLPNVKYFCTNCKNFFDRGGDRAMAEDRLHQEMSDQEVTSEDLEAIIVNLIPVPLQSKGQGVIEKRLQPGLALAEILAKLPLEARKRLKRIRFKGGYKPERFEVSKKAQRSL